MTTIEQNLHSVHARITAACQACARPADSVTLLAVSKTHPASALRQAWGAGQQVFGENYVQEAVEKMAELHDLPLQWHCIGPLQSNKTRVVAEHFDWVHSVDRLKIAQRLSEQRPMTMAPLQLCLQVNIDGGANKSGVAPDEALALARAVNELPGVCLRGLMSIPEPAEGFAAQLAVHQRARALFEELRAALGGTDFDTLSMGMTDDLEAAIHAGSTLVRIGTAIFGRRG